MCARALQCGRQAEVDLAIHAANKALQRLERRLAGRLVLVTCRLQPIDGHWQVHVEGVVNESARDDPLPVRPPTVTGSARHSHLSLRQSATAPVDRALPLALAVAVTDLALRSGQGLRLFRGFGSVTRHRQRTPRSIG